MKYKVGDRVMVRTDLVGGRYYPFSDPFREELYFAHIMEKFRGEEYKIVAIDYVCEVYSLSLGEEESKWVFNDAMLIPVDGLRSLICKRNIK
jgi:hypothetical protein